jgi:hypothetical protein
MSPLAVVFGLLVCVALGYALMRGFSGTIGKPQAATHAKIRSGAFLDAPLPGEKIEVPRVEQPDMGKLPRNAGLAANAEVPENKQPLPKKPKLPNENELAKPITVSDLIGEHMEVTFAKLSNYQYIFPDVEDGEDVPDQIPDSVKKLDGEKVAVAGFMLPVTQKAGRVTEFLLLKDQSLCCFGTMPSMNEWIHVILKPGESAPMVWDIPITVFGTLEVGEVFENGVLMTIYRIRYEKLVKPELER